MPQHHSNLAAVAALAAVVVVAGRDMARPVDRVWVFLRVDAGHVYVHSPRTRKGFALRCAEGWWRVGLQSFGLHIAFHTEGRVYEMRVAHLFIPDRVDVGAVG